MRRRVCVLAVLCVLLCILFSGCSSNAELRFGTGAEGGFYNAFGAAVAPVLEEQIGEPIEVITTTGSEGNINLIDNNLLDIAIVQSDTLQNAVEGTGSFDGNPHSNLSVISSLYTEACQIVASEDSGITSVADLEGKRVSIGEEESGVTRTAEQILMANGLMTDKLDVRRLSFLDSAEALAKGEIDAFFSTAGVPTEFITDLADEISIRLVPLDAHCIDQLTSLYGYYVPFTIPADTYKGQDTPVETLGVRAVLIARKDLDDNIVRAITMGLLEDETNIDDALPPGTIMNLESATRTSPTVGFHPAQLRIMRTRDLM